MKIHITKILIVLLMLLTAPVLLESCCLGAGSCGCGGFGNDPQKKLTVNEITLRAVDSNYNTITVPISRASVYFHIVPKGELSKLETHHPTFAAVACSPAPTEARQKLTSVAITSNREYVTANKTFTAGQDLGELFMIYLNSSFRANEFLGPQTFYEDFMIQIETPISRAQSHNFRFVFTLDDGQTFEQSSGNIELLP